MPDDSGKTHGAGSLKRPERSGSPGEPPLPTVPEVTAVVLAGGMSRRYGKNKALELICGVSLIERAVETLLRVFDRIVISANDPLPYAFLELPVINDLHTGLGQLGGIHACLTAMPGRDCFFVACDMPFLNHHLIRHMALMPRKWDAVVPRIGPHVEPLHALYRKSCLAPINRAIERKERRIVSFYSGIRVRYVEESEIRVFEPDLDVFININRPEELQASLERVRRRARRESRGGRPGRGGPVQT